MKKIINIIKNKLMKNKTKAKVGQLVKVTGNSNSSNYCVGEIYRVVSVDGGGSYINCEALDRCWSGNCMAHGDYVIVGQNKEHFQTQIEQLQKEIEEVQSIMDWMDETGNTEYDMDEHRVWKALTMLEDNTLTKGQRTKLLAQLIKG